MRQTLFDVFNVGLVLVLVLTFVEIARPGSVLLYMPLGVLYASIVFLALVQLYMAHSQTRDS